MKKAYRIKKNEEFQQVFKKGKSFANRQLVIYYLKKEDQNHFRIGLSVSKRIGVAVVRNQIKRYLRQAFHELEDNIDPRYDLIIIARKPTKDMDFHQMKKSLTHVLSKSKLLSKDNKSKI
ncbi:ribonuclease P protein component [Halobacillus sp. MO56]